MPADIRTARVSDIDALVALENTVFEADRISRKSFRHFVSADTAVVLIAEAAGKLTGYAVVLFRKGNAGARLYSIAAAPDAGNGYGRKLLDAAERAARDRGARSLRLEVRHDNDRARILYEKNGYRRIGEVAGYYADGATAFKYEKPMNIGAAKAGAPAVMELRRA
ncbi:Ribosomal protein S18 acetylase RimI [Mesorhizobium albiziae]|uniref:Ribosomal protein S18 acetylase RimI n=1 Tax=Neomesorhizobium albiziae TaxID=335020 RepID=A0A1I4APT6_9HYPH|nr:Ribosomal protein S18 acetylase RimI [Mesorhizobium albiziae]